MQSVKADTAAAASKTINLTELLLEVSRSPWQRSEDSVTVKILLDSLTESFAQIASV